ncbi:hypothetical protein BJF78_14530 [Pseudonocardia sp. CNS-139]|nr:hypothetical protein BJF78_14530 [Pseudonocardia sp. CNS-139]
MAEIAERGALVLVHGAWHGSWCWELLVPELTARGWRVSALDLPSTSGDPDAGMLDDARVVREHLAAIEGPVTVLAHSYGGIPVAEVADTVPGVEALVYLAAHMLAPGESLVSPIGGPWYPAGTTLLPAPEPAVDLLFHDVPADLAERSVARLRPQSARAFGETQTRAAWRTLPTGLILCDEDRAFPELFAKRQETWPDLLRRMPTGHSPFLSRPASWRPGRRDRGGAALGRRAGLTDAPHGAAGAVRVSRGPVRGPRRSGRRGA